MKKFGSWTEQVNSKFRASDNSEVTLAPFATPGADITFTLPGISISDNLVTDTSSSTLTNKTIDADATGNNITNLEDANIKAAAAIALNKLAAITANRVPVSDGSGFIISSSVTDTELGQLAGIIFGGSDPDDLVTVGGSQTLTNKTLTLPVISGIVNTGTLTLPTTTDTLIGRNTTDTLTNKSIDADTNTITNIDNNDIKALAGIDATKVADGSVDNTEFQKLGTVGTNSPGEIVSTDGTQTLTNKTLTSPAINSPEINEAVALTATSTELNQLDGVTVGGNTTGDIIDTNSTQTVFNKQLDDFKYGSTGVAAASTVGKGNQTVIRLTGTATDLTAITGATGLDGLIKIVVNETDDVIKLVDGTAVDGGFITGTNADVDLQINAAIQMRYDNSVNRWKFIGGAGSGGGLTLANASSAINPAVKNTHYLTDSSGGAFSITLPAGEEGATFRFSDITNSWSTNNVTLTPDGAETIDGQANLVLDVDSTWVQLMWDNAGGQWVSDDAIVPANADFTGDVNITGDLAVDNITDAAGTDFPALNGIKPTIFYEKKTLATATQSSSLNPVPDLTWSGSLEIGKTYRITLHINGFVSLNNNSDLTAIMYDGDSVGGGTAILQRVHTNNATGTANGFFTVDSTSTIHTMTTTTLTTRFILLNASFYGNSNFNTYVIVEELPYHQSTTFI